MGGCFTLRTKRHRAGNTSNFWVAGMDSQTGHLSGIASRITTGDDFVDQPNVTADGKRLVFNRLKPQLDVYLAEFFAQGPRLGTPRRLTLDDADDLPFDWTFDDRAVLFTQTELARVTPFPSSSSGSIKPPPKC